MRPLFLCPATDLFLGAPPSVALLEGVRNAIFLQKPKEISRVLIDDDVLSRDVNTKSIWGKVFAVLRSLN